MASNRLDTLVWSVLLLLLILAPLPSGSVSSISQASLTCGLFTLLATSYAHPHSPPRWPPLVERRFQVIIRCWTLAAAFAFFQIVPLPPAFIAVVSPYLSDLYSWSLPTNQGSAWRALSTTPAATVQSGLLIGACAAAFLLVTRHCRSRGRMLILAITIALVGLGEALYGLAQLDSTLTAPASGTFVNRNHFAAFVIMALGVSMGLLLARWQEGTVGTMSGAFESGMRFDRWARTSPLLVLSLIMFAAIIFSSSRTGLILSLVMVIFFGILGSRGSSARWIGFVSIAIGTTAILLVNGAWRGLKVVADRFESLQEAYRLAAWHGTFDLFQLSPLVGIGLGGLVDHLARFLPVSIKETFDHTHNEPLEVLAEGGLIYGVLFAAGLLVYFSTVMPAWVQRRDALTRGVGWGSLVGACAVLLFSLVEFPLRMPANIFTLSVILALTWVSIHHRTQSSTSDARQPARSRPYVMQRLMLVLAVVGLILSAVTVTASLLEGAGDQFVKQADTSSGERKQDLLNNAVQWYRRAQQIEPWQPSHAFKLGRAFDMTASMFPPVSEDTLAAWASATASYERAIRLHPANARLQAALSWAALQSGDLTQARHAVHAALKLAPGDPNIRFAVSRWYLVQWENLSDEERHTALPLIRQGVADLPLDYMETIWRFVPDLTTIKNLLPDDLRVRRLLLRTLTERQLFSDRWAEQDAYPALRLRSPEKELLVLSYGRVAGRQNTLTDVVSAGAWTGMVEGWLSAGLTATSRVVVPPGEAVIFMPIRGEAAGGLWPTVSITLGGHAVPLSTVSETGWRTVYVHVFTEGGTFPLQAVLTNGAVIRENAQFVERRVSLGPIRMLTPQPFRGAAVRPSGKEMSFTQKSP